MKNEPYYGLPPAMFRLSLVTFSSICASLLLCLPVAAAERASDEIDWLFGKQIELYDYLLRGVEVEKPLREKLQEGFHRFAFEYWLVQQENPTAVSAKWRYHVRISLHREGKNQKYFNDPALFMPFFKDGKLSPSLAIAPVAKLDSLGLSKVKYIEMVNGFQRTFFDATNVFPVIPIPPESVSKSGEPDEQSNIGQFLNGRKWNMISRDRLPIRYQSEPFLLFGQLSPAGQAYYIPAFLFMCESEEGRVGDLARKLAEELAGDSPSSIELRSKLTSTQKKCIGTFFEDLFRGNQDSVSLLMQIRVRLNTVAEIKP